LEQGKKTRKIGARWRDVAAPISCGMMTIIGKCSASREERGNGLFTVDEPLESGVDTELYFGRWKSYSDA